MSLAATSVKEVDDPLVEASSASIPRRDLLVWSLASTSLLFVGGALRVAGSSTSRSDNLTATAPFDLKNIPQTFDAWTIVEGSETHLDNLTTRITGSTSHVIRNYFNELTGTTLSVLILYGPAEPVLPHTPQVCYPASGYKSLGEATDRTIVVNDHLSAVFRAALFAKSGGRFVIRQSVYHSYRLDGVWSPMVTDRSLPRRQAGLFKIQIQRRVHDGERVDGEEPIESFLQQLLPSIEQMIADSTATLSAGVDAKLAPSPASRP